MSDTMMTEPPAFRNRSTEIAKLAAALAKAQKAFAPIPKDREVTVTTQTGGSYKFKYATLDAICAATFPALAEQGLAVSQSLTNWGDHYALETSLFHSSGEWLSNVTPMFLSGRRTKEGKELPPGNQELGSAQTYARRYGLSALLCITADEDDDGNHADGNQSERTPFKPGARGTAGGGTQFRPEKRTGWAKDAESDGTLDTTRAKGSLPAKGAGREATPEQARLTKITAATNKRIEALKSQSVWTRDGLDQFWNDDKKWIDWMADPNNEALKEYERFTDAFNEAEMNIKPVELA